MKWNWQRSDWPRFSWDAARLRKAEEHFLWQSGMVAGVLKHVDGGDREQLVVETISAEALTTSEIEGDILDRASVQSSMRRQFGLETGKRKVKPAEQGIAEMMVDLHRSFAGDLSEEMLTRAGMAHLYFESIYPFEDGNGRIGRAICEKALAQSVGQPTLIALAATILVRQKAYYQQLEAANKDKAITTWLVWFAGIALEAQRRTEARVEFLLEKTRLLDRLRGKINMRQEKALLRMLREGPEGFKGGLSAGNYATITNASPATTTRDLADLATKGALVRSGERRHARYSLAIPLRAVRGISIDAQGDLRED